MKITEQEEILLDPRQKMCWDFYTNPKSDSFGNVTQSGLKAGFSLSTSKQITNTDWFRGRKLRMNLLGKAEKVIDKILSIEDTMDDKGKERADLLRVQADVSKHVTKTQGKDEGWNERTELTGQDGNPIVILPATLIEKFGLGEEKE